MDRSRTLTGGRRLTTAGALLACFVAIGLVVGAQSAPPAIQALDALIGRAATTSPGTYQLQGASIDAARTPLPLLVQADVLRAADRTIRVPLVVGTDVPQTATVRVRVVNTAADPSRAIAEVTGTAEAGPSRFVREFSLPPGEYEVYAAVAYPAGGEAVTAVLAKVALRVPDPWGGSLALTPLVIGETVGLVPAGTGSRPFNFGPTSLTPATAPAFSQGSMLHVAYRVFNWRADPGAAPDLTAEYVFHEDQSTRPVFFNKVKPQRLTAQTLGRDFDAASGAVAAGLSVSLAPFQQGDFSLTVRVRDNRARTAAEQRVRFSVRR